MLHQAWNMLKRSITAALGMRTVDARIRLEPIRLSMEQTLDLPTMGVKDESRERREESDDWSCRIQFLESSPPTRRRHRHRTSGPMRAGGGRQGPQTHGLFATVEHQAVKQNLATSEETQPRPQARIRAAAVRAATDRSLERSRHRRGHHLMTGT